LRVRERHGFSLMEVIFATAILMGRAIVLSRLAGMGRTQASKAERHSDAQRLCEHTLNEVLLGLRPFEPIEDAPLRPVELESPGNLDEQTTTELLFGRRTEVSAFIETTPRWNYSVRTASVPQAPELTALTVEVAQADIELPKPVRYQLTRWIRVASADRPSRLTPSNEEATRASSLGRGFSEGFRP